VGSKVHSKKPKKGDVWIDEFGARFYVYKGGDEVLFLNIETEALFVQRVDSFILEYENEKDYQD
jgi:hypothetical protein